MNNLMQFFRKVFRLNDMPEVSPAVEEDETCCEGVVHIVYRGVSDDKLYMASGRRWPEVKFFKPNGLRVFCAGCRRRLL